MKGRDLRIFIYILIISLILGTLCCKYIDINEYDSLITFLSIIIGFEITSLAILFNTPLKRTLYDRPIKHYQTELHRLRDLYRFSIYVSLLSILIIFLTPCFCFSIKWVGCVDKSIIVLPILATSVYCMIVLCEELFSIFVYPTNEN